MRAERKLVLSVIPQRLRFVAFYLQSMNYSGARPLSDTEIEMVLSGYRGRYAKRDRLLLIFGVYTGFRIQESLSVKVGGVYDGTRIFNEVCVEKGFMKGKARNRTMPLHATVKAAIADWLDEYLKDLPNPLERPLFPRQRTMFAMTRSQAVNILVRAAVEAGVDVHRVSSHSARKTFARRLWESPLVQRDMAKMARLLGHENFSNTLRYLEFADNLERAVLSV